MTLLVALLAAAPCAHPGLEALSEDEATAACELLTGPAPRPSLSRDALAAIYAEPGFEGARARRSGVLAALWARALERLGALFESRAAATYSSAARVVVLGLGLAASIGLLGVSLARRRARMARGPRRATARSLPHPGEELDLDEARELLEASPREAMRRGVLALLSWLEDAGLARRDRVRTNREIARDLPRRGAAPELCLALEALLAEFDRRFYALEDIPPEVAGRFLDDAARVRALLPTRAR